MNHSNITNTCNVERKSVQDLDLINAFLFRASTENSENAEFIAKLIIERATGRKVEQISVMSEKVLTGIDLGQHGICMDLYVEEYEDGRKARVYDIEPNNYGAEELPMRSRYSQALTDVKLLGAGENYRNLQNYISIWILPFDPFGKNKMLYTIKNFVAEDTQIVYNDGAMKLFLYTAGEIGGNDKLKDMLRYFSKSDEENAVDSDLLKLHSIVQQVKDNRKVGEQYMTLQDYLDCEIKRGVEKGIADALAEGIAEGRAEGRAEAIATAVKMFRGMNVPEEQILVQLVKNYNLTEEKAKSYLDK